MKVRITNDVTDYVTTRERIRGSPDHYLSHTAVAIGYLARDSGYIESYKGKYGTGYIIHVPTNETAVKGSKRYHMIEYWIDK